MRKPYPLLLDLCSLILQAATEPQRNLHFPLFRTSNSRAVSRSRPRRSRSSIATAKTHASSILNPSRAGSSHDLSQLRAAAGAQRPDRALPASPQLALFQEVSDAQAAIRTRQNHAHDGGRG